MNTQAYKNFKRDLKVLDQIPKYKNIIMKEPEDMTDSDWKIWSEYDQEMSRLWTNVEEESYKELYDLFYKVTGYTLDLLEVDWDDFKTMVQENLGYDEEVYDLYFPDMVQNFLRVGELWFEQTNETRDKIYYGQG